MQPLPVCSRRPSEKVHECDPKALVQSIMRVYLLKTSIKVR